MDRSIALPVDVRLPTANVTLPAGTLLRPIDDCSTAALDTLAADPSSLGTHAALDPLLTADEQSYFHSFLNDLLLFDHQTHHPTVALPLDIHQQTMHSIDATASHDHLSVPPTNHQLPDAVNNHLHDSSSADNLAIFASMQHSQQHPTLFYSNNPTYAAQDSQSFFAPLPNTFYVPSHNQPTAHMHYPGFLFGQSTLSSATTLNASIPSLIPEHASSSSRRTSVSDCATSTTQSSANKKQKTRSSRKSSCDATNNEQSSTSAYIPLPGTVPPPVLAPRKPRHTSPTMLSKSEKRANHVASEQKRRQNIRNGFCALALAVPSLRASCGLKDTSVINYSEFTAHGTINGMTMPPKANTITKTIEYIEHLNRRTEKLLRRLQDAQRKAGLPITANASELLAQLNHAPPATTSAYSQPSSSTASV